MLLDIGQLCATLVLVALSSRGDGPRGGAPVDIVGSTTRPAGGRRMAGERDRVGGASPAVHDELVSVTAVAALVMSQMR